MINKSYNYCKLFSQYPNIIYVSYCFSVRKDNNNIILQNPQLIYSLSINKVNYNITTPNLDLVSNGDTKQDINSSVKFERKNKSDFLLNYDTNSKKNKISSKRKQRSKRSLDPDDLLINDSSTESEVDSFNVDLMKPIKSRKQKKKHQSKQYIDINQEDYELNIYNKYNVTNNLNSDIDIKKEIILDTPLKIQHLADKLNISEASIITWLFLQGISVTINQVVDVAIATKVAKHYNFTILDTDVSNLIDVNVIKQTEINVKNSHTVERAPIVTIVGHVDHGKTTLLDFIRNTNVVNKEVGGITQSITGYEVSYEYMGNLKNLIFLDTPGHEAFSAMRLRGIEVTDIAILIVAADDGLKPQTIEAINYIISRKIPYIVAINKIDKQGINIANIRDQLSNYGIIDVEWGGDSSIVEVSALKGINLDNLLYNICYISDTLNLRTNLQNHAEGVIVESYLNKKTGPIATVVLKNGTLNLGDIIVSGNIYGKVKAITDSNGLKISIANASAIIKIAGFSSVPKTGLEFYVVDNEKIAKSIISKKTSLIDKDQNTKLLNTRVTLESYKNNAHLKIVNIILKADTQGSIEAIIHAFAQIPQDKVQINIISYSSGSVFDKDLDLAITSQSIIIVFNLNVLLAIRSSAEKLNVTIKEFNIIYDLLDYVKTYMLNLVKPEYDKVAIGQAVVQTVFNINKGIVAGCFVKSGVIIKGCYMMVYRNDHIVYEGTLDSLRRLKDNVDEVMEGNECGIMSIHYSLWQKLDRIEAFQMIQKEKIL